jgi:tetratricopeptide (TPR) repeat protein
MHYEFFRSYFSGDIAAVEERLKLFRQLQYSTDASLQEQVEFACKSGSLDELSRLQTLLMSMEECSLIEIVIKRKIELLRDKGRCLSVGEEEEALKANEKVPAEHLNLGKAFALQSRHDMAMSQYLKAVELIKALQAKSTAHSVGHDRQLFYYNLLEAAYLSIGEVYFMKCKFADAEKSFRLSFELSRRIYGDNNILTADRYHWLVSALLQQGKIDEAIPILLDTCKTVEAIEGKKSIRLISFNISLSLAYMLKGDITEATSFIKRSLHDSERVKGVMNLTTITTMTNLGYTLLLQGKISDSKEILEKALEYSLQVNGEFHEATGKTATHLILYIYIFRLSSSRFFTAQFYAMLPQVQFTTICILSTIIYIRQSWPPCTHSKA